MEGFPTQNVMHYVNQAYGQLTSQSRSSWTRTLNLYALPAMVNIEIQKQFSEPRNFLMVSDHKLI